MSISILTQVYRATAQDFLKIVRGNFLNNFYHLYYFTWYEQLDHVKLEIDDKVY